MLPRCNKGVNRNRIKHTPKIVFENVIAALTLAEQFLNSTEM